MLHRNMKRSITLCLTVMGIMSALISCKNNNPENVAALVTTGGEPAGLVITYKGEIDKSSVNLDTYEVKGHTASLVFVSKTNPFMEKGGQEGLSFAVILLKEEEGNSVNAVSKVEIIPTVPNISVRQVKDIKTVKGKTVPAWNGDFKATEAFPIGGGLRK